MTPFPDPSSRPPAPPPEPIELTPEELAHFRAVTDESPEAAQEYERKRTNWLRYVILFVILGLGLYVLLPQVGDLRESTRILRGMRLWAVGLAVLCEVASYTALGYMMHRIVGLTGQRLPMRRAVAVTVASGSVGLVAGGLVGMGGSSYRWLRDGGVRTEGAVLAGWLPALLNAAMVALCAIVGMITLALMGELTPALWVAFIFSLLVVLGFGGIAWFASHHHAAAERLAVRAQARWARFRKKPEKPENVRATVAGIFDALSLLRRRGWKGPALGSFMGVGLDALCMYFVFVAAQRPVAFGVLLAGYGIPLLVGKVGIIPGGVGLVEGMMVAIFSGVGVPTATAVSVVLGFRVLSFWLPNLAGFGIMPLLQTSRRVRDPADSPSRAT